MTQFWYGLGQPKNLHNRIIKDKGDTVIWRNADGKKEEVRVVERTQSNVVVCAESGDWLRLWF